ncbi:MAG TPA: DUF4337 domain-containing protein [Bryobacteraceae bacterium]|nr:DUF4337 domain-containing protein [Bryobacteraceae bacterium]
MSIAEELKEHAEHANEPFDRNVALAMAIIAAALAIVSVLGHMATTEELLAQERATDTWAEYQAKAIRRYQSESTVDLLGGLKADPAVIQNYKNRVQHYQKSGEETQQQARDLEKESRHSGRVAFRFHLGEVFLEIAIVFASLAILTKRMFFFIVGIACGVIGVVAAAATIFLV